MLGTTLGPYRLEKELGSGGMGAVYLATALEDAAGVKSGTKVAVKIVHPQRSSDACSCSSPKCALTYRCR